MDQCLHGSADLFFFTKPYHLFTLSPPPTVRHHLYLRRHSTFAAPPPPPLHSSRHPLSSTTLASHLFSSTTSPPPLKLSSPTPSPSSTAPDTLTMAGTTTRNDVESSTSSDAVGILTGLNRIKTRIPVNNNDNIRISSNSVHTKSLMSWFKQNHQRSFGRGFVKLHSSREDCRGLVHLFCYRCLQMWSADCRRFTSEKTNNTKGTESC
ncbi:hypothetical protein Hanom_Chr14g01330131 [Helianthus anomalus]